MTSAEDLYDELTARQKTDLRKLVRKDNERQFKRYCSLNDIADGLVDELWAFMVEMV